MTDRVWFFAEGDKQLGPYPESQLRDFIAGGKVSAATFVWTEGMSGWQRAGDVPGLIPDRIAQPAPPTPPGAPQRRDTMARGGLRSGSPGSGSLGIDFGICDFTWRSIVLMLCSFFVIPLPWVLVWYLKWLAPHVQVPGRPNLSFEGTAMTIVPWFFGGVVVIVALAMTGSEVIGNLSILVQVVLYWLFVKWLIANLATDGRPLGLGFSGSVWAYLGWTLLGIVSIFTIIGWAWVYTAWTRWLCANIQGTRRAVVFNGSGLDFLWRAIVTIIAASFIIPIPWAYRWMMQWLASQTELVER